MSTWTIASWNVNSLRVRAPQVIEWLQTQKADVLCLQETKCIDADFPKDLFDESGYHCVYVGQKAYNGMAIVSRGMMDDVLYCPMDWAEDSEKRFLAATIQGIRIINIYVPNGMAVGSSKFEYKLNWLKEFKLFLKDQLKQYSQLMVLGDFNIAPAPEDVFDPERCAQDVLFTPTERTALQDILSLGLEDTFRWVPQPPQLYSWWDYRTRAFASNRGMRIDLILATPSLRSKLLNTGIDLNPRRHERPSDHAPVFATFKT